VNTIIANKRYSANLVGYDEAPSYEEKISALTAQKNYLESEYSKLSAYGEKADAGKATLRNIFTTSQQNELKAHIIAYKYVLSPETYIDGAAAEIAALEKKIADNINIIEGLRKEQEEANKLPNNVPVVTDPYEDRIAALIEDNGKLQNNIDSINATLTAIESYTVEGADKEAKLAFDKRLDDFRVQLEGAAETLKTVSVSIYGDNSRVVFSNNKLEKQGGISWVISAILGALLGFVVSSVVVYFVGVSKYKREKLAAAKSCGKADAESGTEAEVVAEAAASDDNKN
ncbi:MAG: hypothetical protein K2O81_02410, partial [Clostridia bacterium]|nr:hypothetical protein [Clostridia bacterium]